MPEALHSSCAFQNLFQMKRYPALNLLFMQYNFELDNNFSLYWKYAKVLIFPALT